MKEMSLDEIHEVNLEILKIIDSFCREHKIRYMLGYGTLLGAVRHSGFIPWDDDADVIMLRNDYDRFLKEFSDSEDYHFYAPEKGDSLLTYGRLCEMKRTFFRARSKWALRDRPGVGVDVFPIDAVGDSVSDTEMVDSLYCAVREMWRLRGSRMIYPASLRLSRSAGFLRNLKNIVHLVFRFPRVPWSMIKSRTVLERFLKCLRLYKSNHSNMVGNLTIPTYADKEKMPASWFLETTEAEFERTMLSVPKHYSDVLRNYYGDYMKLPPEDQRGTHGTVQTMCWR